MCRRFSRQMGIFAKLKKDTCAERKSRLWYFLEVCRHNFVQSSKDKDNKEVMPRSQLRCGLLTAEPLGSLVPISVLRLLQTHLVRTSAWKFASRLHPFSHRGHIAPLLVTLTWNTFRLVFTSLLYCKVYFFPLCY